VDIVIRRWMRRLRTLKTLAVLTFAFVEKGHGGLFPRPASLAAVGEVIMS
jgi:hypothetical protein